MGRFICIHGHFYQPPRENPWLNVVEREPSAHPDHDWNCRIARECYVPNGAARIINPRGEIVDLVNNYSFLSFDFGPTLLSWFEHERPSEYRRIIEADRQSFRRLDGHGNAIAHAYNHMILPLANERDLATQIRWGLADFKHRFGRDPEAMWLPETAANDAVLRALIDHGLSYVILSNHQAQRCRPIGKKEWKDVSSGSIDPGHPFRWFDHTGPSRGQGVRHIDVFFYDGGISHALSFERILTDSKAAADRLEGAFGGAAAGPGKGAQLVTAATDGETFGHHHAFAEMGLAHLFMHELPVRKLQAVNYGYYLARNPPAWEVELKPGEQDMGTSWSCGHGLGRWMEDCGCGAPKGQGRWRKPMRDAMDFLRDAMTSLFEEHGGRLLKDVWAARDAYIGVMLDRSQEGVSRFLKGHLKVEPTPQVQESVLRLMEMQKNCLFMYTSCGWFFADISGIEAVQNLKYAARAIELASRVSGTDLEDDFVQRLRLAPSNHPEIGADGAAVYRKLVRPSVISHDHVAAQYAMSLLFDDGPRRPLPVAIGGGTPEPETPGSGRENYHYDIRQGGLVRRSTAGMRLLAGRAAFQSGITHKRWERAFLAVGLPDQTVKAFVSGESFSEEDYQAMIRKLPAVTGSELLEGLESLRTPLFPGRAFGLPDLLPDERARILSMILEMKFAALRSRRGEFVEEYLPLAERFAGLGLAVPSLVRGELELALCQWIGRRTRDLCASEAAGRIFDGPLPELDGMRAMAERVKKAGLSMVCGEADEEWSALLADAIERLETRLSDAALAAFKGLVEAGLEIGFKGWRGPTETRFFQLLQKKRFGRGLALDPAGLLALAKLLNIDGEALQERLASGKEARA
ncbi:MAG: DUF3536 domain-containing protein [Elusimicrobia bacterium]|nr:DUF3536 domain-containing protein [Elusimicrobiota bacterium]